jgi:uncharacterized membrane protein (UPF0127 family)
MKSGTVISFLSCPLFALPACAEDPRVCFKETCYSVEIAQTPDARERGLMGRGGLKSGAGMLFIFEASGRYGFWMKNMKFPIDIIWLDNAKKVVHIAKSVPPCRKDPCPVYMPPYFARYIVEIPSGDAASKKIRLFDQAIFQLP